MDRDRQGVPGLWPQFALLGNRQLLFSPGPPISLEPIFPGDTGAVPKGCRESRFKAKAQGRVRQDTCTTGTAPGPN